MHPSDSLPSLAGQQPLCRPAYTLLPAGTDDIRAHLRCMVEITAAAPGPGSAPPPVPQRPVDPSAEGEEPPVQGDHRGVEAPRCRRHCAHPRPLQPLDELGPSLVHRVAVPQAPAAAVSCRVDVPQARDGERVPLTRRSPHHNHTGLHGRGPAGTGRSTLPAGEPTRGPAHIITSLSV